MVRPLQYVGAFVVFMLLFYVVAFAVGIISALMIHFSHVGGADWGIPGGLPLFAFVAGGATGAVVGVAAVDRLFFHVDTRKIVWAFVIVEAVIWGGSNVLMLLRGAWDASDLHGVIMAICGGLAGLSQTRNRATFLSE
jgi:hypothetical protein